VEKGGRRLSVLGQKDSSSCKGERGKKNIRPGRAKEAGIRKEKRGDVRRK